MSVTEIKSHIDRLELTNFRLFGKIQLDLHPELTVLVAPNGGGKTALLDAIALALRPFVDVMDGKPQAKGIARSDIRRVMGPDGHPQLVLPVHIALGAHLLGTEVDTSRALASERGRTTGDSSGLTGLAKRLYAEVIGFALRQRATRPELPVVAYYGTGRLWNIGRLTALKRGDRDPTPNSPTRGYTEALSSNSHYELFAEWFMRLSRELGSRSSLTPDGGRSLERLHSTVRRAIDAVLAPSGWHGLAPDWTDETLYMQRQGGPRLPVSSLSDGIRTMVGLAGDIAHRCARLNPDFGEEAAERTQGLVIIDEVDMHLHPGWQQVVLTSLRKAFPKVQLIVTTHSPQVLSTVPRESIRILAQDPGEDTWHARPPDAQTEGVASALVMANVMGVDATPENLHVRRLHEYGALIAAGQAQHEDALRLRASLVAHYGNDSPVMLECDRSIRLEDMKRRMLKRGGA